MTENATNKNDDNDNSLFWKVGTPLPSEFQGNDLFLSSLVPRATAWVTVGDDKNTNKVSLLEGWNMANVGPPALMFAANALPQEFVQTLLEKHICTLSSGTSQQPLSAYRAAARQGGTTPVMTFETLTLTPVVMSSVFPPGVGTSPIHMQCRLMEAIDLGNGEKLILVEAETIIVDGTVISSPTESMAQTRDVLGKIDVELMDPVMCLGNGRFACMTGLYLMPRPKKREDGTWYSTNFDPAPPTLGKGKVDTVHYVWRIDPNVFGYNPIKAIAMPRPIGWLSTYSKDGRIPHLAPYSFFMDAGRNDQPMVVFAGYRTNDGQVKKDAQTNVEAIGYFGWNVVTHDLAVRMNLSAAELDRDGCEFELANLSPTPSPHIDAPMVAESPIRMECEYIKSVDVGNFTCVVSKVLSISVSDSVLTNGEVDVSKLKPLARCGYTDEYVLVSKALE